MKKWLALASLLFGLSTVSHAGTPQENGQYPFQAASYSASTILASSASTTSAGASIALTVSTPTVFNSGGLSQNGRNCFTRIFVQMSTSTVLTVADNLTTKWTIYGSGLGTTGVSTLSLPEDHLGPLCTSAGNQTVFTLTNTAGLPTNAEAVNVEGYTTYGGTNGQVGPMN